MAVAGVNPPDIPGLRLADRIGTGAQGSVYVAEDRNGERVAVKFMPFGDVDQDAARERFLREAQLLAGLRHPHLVAVRDFGVVAGGCYLVMELLQGRPLSEHVGAPVAAGATAAAGAVAEPEDVTQRLPSERVAHLTHVTGGTELAADRLRTREHWRRIAQVGVDLCGALSRLHGAGVAHRDIKPANVVIADGGRAVLVDLSLVSAADLPPDPNSDGGGTYGYMSPEQRLGRAPTPRSDIYSLACTLYACLVGRPPPGGTMPLEARAAALLAANPALPPTLAEVIARCLQADPLARYPSVDDLCGDLQAVLASQPLGWRPKTRRRPRRFALVILVLLGGFTIWSLWPASLAELVARCDVVAIEARLRAHPDQVTRDLRAMATTLDPTSTRCVETVATALGWALLCVGASAEHRVHVVAHLGIEPQDDRPAVKPQRTTEFVPLTKPVAFALPPGYATVRILDTNRGSGWPDGQPRVFHLLRRVDAHERTDIDPSVLPPLGGGQLALGPGAWFRLPAGEHDYTDCRSGTAVRGRLRLDCDLIVGATECPSDLVQAYGAWVVADWDRRSSLFAHPLEEDVDIRQELRQAAMERYIAPAVVSYWLAFRAASFVGSRLPNCAEWGALAHACYPDGGPAVREWLEVAQKHESQRLPVDANDEFPNAHGVLHLLDNVREWVSTVVPPKAGAKDPAGWACPALTRPRVPNARPIRIGCVTAVSLSDQLALRPTARAGFRLLRDALQNQAEGH